MIKHTFLIFICSINTVTAAISIQKPEVADLAKVKELMRIVWFETYTKFYSPKVVEQVTEAQTIEYLQYQLEDESHHFLVAKKNDQIVGVITSQRQSPEVAKVIRLYIHPDHRSLGIGAMLLKATMEYFEDVKEINIPVKEKNERAIAFYSRHGFQQVAKENHDLFDETAVNVILQKKIRTENH